MKNLRCYFLGHKEGESDKGSWEFKCPDCRTYFDTTATSGSYSKWRNTFWETTAWEYTRIIGSAFLVVALLLAAVAVPVYFIGKASCNEYAKMGIETAYNFWTGCMAKHSDFGWVPVEKYFEILTLYVK